MRYGLAVWLGLCGAVLFPAYASAQAETYPVRPIRVIVPTTPAGPNDILTRLIAERLTAIFGRQVIVDNRPGAGGRIGMEVASKANADGYTLILASQAHLTIHPALYQLSYDLDKDFAPIVLVGRVRYLLLVNPAVPANTLGELLILLRSNPGQFNFASVGAGTSSHMVAEIFKKTAKVDIVHVPYKGASPAYADLVAGQVHLMFASPLAMSPYIKNRQVKAIAIAAPRRSALLPDFPTFAESGMPDFEGSAWWAVMTRAGVPSKIVARLNTEINGILQLPKMRERLATLDVEAAGGSVAELGVYLRSERAKWEAVIKEARITIQ